MSETELKMKYTYFALFAALTITACNQKEPEETTTSDKDTVVVHDTVTVKEETKVIEKQPTESKPSTSPPAEPKKKPWADKMAEYHALRCRQHNNQGTTSDQVDRVVLLKDLNDIRDKLSKDERFYFNADMVKAEDMSTCGK
jgi:hypothetical protein